MQPGNLCHSTLEGGRARAGHVLTGGPAATLGSRGSSLAVIKQPRACPKHLHNAHGLRALPACFAIPSQTLWTTCDPWR